MRWSDINGGYEHFYDTEQCKKENLAIQRYLIGITNSFDWVVDYGCGAGLSWKLLTDAGIDPRWNGIEIDEGFEHLPGMIYMDAAPATKILNPDVVVCLFAAEEIGVARIVSAVRRAKKALIIWYKKPYNDEGSYWFGKKIRWFMRYFVKSRLLRILLNKHYAGTLLDEEGYYVGIKK